MEKELLNLFTAASEAADVAAAPNVLPDGPEVCQCVRALKKLLTFNITKELLTSTKVRY